ncbi:MAG: hypothetical protein Q9M29_00220 [Mariprofundaceae bacterium]|nr:hypothetical protein [Mariprofundaceae bacterium]
MKRPPVSCNRLALVAGLLVLVSSCADVEKTAISSLMDARDHAVSTQDISAYSALIYNNYQDKRQGKIEVVARMIALFARFEATEMRSYDRTIRILDDTHAQCEQSYTLRVKADGTWREIVQREQLQLIRTPSGWKIRAGL